VNRGSDADHGPVTADPQRLRDFRREVYRCLDRRAAQASTWRWCRWAHPAVPFT